jgi:tripartite-type tricarboxylate transporter receptor subunit TctC
MNSIKTAGRISTRSVTGGSMRIPLASIGALVVLASALGQAPVSAQTDAFFAGKTISLYIGNSVGGGYDLYARILARHMVRHIPGAPMIVAKNMEGGGSLRAANFMASVAPRDGTAFATIGRGTAFAPLIGQRGANFDATKLTWVGSANDEVSACASWHTSGVVTAQDLFSKELVIGSTVASDDASQLPKLMNGLLGTKFKLVLGYPGGNEMNLAMERTETQGRCGLSWSSFAATQPEWVKSKKVNLLFQVSFAKHRDLPEVPLLLDLANTPEQRQILRLFAVRQVMGRPFFAPPDVPADRAAILRNAFDRTMADAEFLAEATKAKLEINPVSGVKVEQIVKEIYQTPPDLVKKAAELMN